MPIDIDLLLTWGAVSKRYKKHELVFNEGEEARYYYQLETGSVRMFNVNDDGKEFTQSNFSAGCSFGEPPLFLNEKYPATAQCMQDAIILKLSGNSFLEILETYPLIQKSFLELLARRIFNKAIIVKNVINHTPEERIVEFLKNYKKCHGFLNGEVHIPITRQEIANCTGLRVETVIRTLQKMQQSGRVEILDRKLLY